MAIHGAVLFFAVINLYTFVAAHIVRMLHDHHGIKKGFVIGNVIILATLIMVLLFSHQI